MERPAARAADPDQRRGNALRDVAEVGPEREATRIVDEMPAQREHCFLHRSRHLFVRPEPADDRVTRPDRAWQRIAEQRSDLVESGFLVRTEQEMNPHVQPTAFLDVALELDVLDDRVRRWDLLDGDDRSGHRLDRRLRLPWRDRVPMIIARSRCIQRDSRETVSSNSGCA